MLSMPKPAVGDPLCARVVCAPTSAAHLGFRPRPATPAPTRVGSLGFRFHTPIRAPRAHIGSRALARTRPEHLQKRKITCSAHRTRTLDFGPARRPGCISAPPDDIHIDQTPRVYLQYQKCTLTAERRLSKSASASGSSGSSTHRPTEVTSVSEETYKEGRSGRRMERPTIL